MNKYKRQKYSMNKKLSNSKQGVSQCYTWRGDDGERLKAYLYLFLKNSTITLNHIDDFYYFEL